MELVDSIAPVCTLDMPKTQASVADLKQHLCWSFQTSARQLSISDDHFNTLFKAFQLNQLHEQFEQNLSNFFKFLVLFFKIYE